MLGLRCIRRRVPTTLNRTLHSRIQVPRAFYSNLSRTVPVSTQQLYGKEYRTIIVNHGVRRWNSTTSASPPANPEDMGTISAEDLAYVKAQATEQWPPMLKPDCIPPGWSQDFANWEYLPTLFWFSPYVYNIPQIDLLMGLVYRVNHTLRPIMYKVGAESEGQFIFSLVGEDADPNQWYFCNPTEMDLFHFPAPNMTEGILDVAKLSLTPSQPDASGFNLLLRVLQGDETVGEELQEYLPTMTVPSKPDGPTAKDILEQAQNQTDLPPEFLAQIQSLKDAEEQVAAQRDPDIEELERSVERASESLAKWDEVDKKLDEAIKAYQSEEKQK